MSNQPSHRRSIAESIGLTSAAPTRRRFMIGAAGMLAAPAILRGARAEAGEIGTGLFSLGVMSGDPDGDSFVLWTRLAPDPLNGGGMPNERVNVKVTVARDPGMTQIVRRAVVRALPQDGHAVHVKASRLSPNTIYYYQFEAMGEQSPIGRTRTFPTKKSDVDRMRFAFTSCQDYEAGFFSAWSDIAALAERGEDIDFVCQLGDYIYEYAPAATPPVSADRLHDGTAEIFSVEDYRNRYALYRLDPALQRAQALYPFIVTPDDHEVDNNVAGLVSEELDVDPDEFLQRRRNALQVYGETMPLRRNNRRQNSKGDLILYRTLSFGALADIHVFDTRSFRTDQPAGDGFGTPDALADAADPATLSLFIEADDFDAEGILDPNATMLGRRQEKWLDHQLAKSRSTWNVLAQQVMVTPWNLIQIGAITAAGATPLTLPQVQAGVFGAVDELYNVDAWDGYQAARERLYAALERTGASNPVVLTGDIHSSWAADLLRDPTDPASQMIAAEFVCTSISSTFAGQNPLGTDLVVRASVQADNPNIKFFNGMLRGYALCDVTSERWRTTYRAVTPSGVATPSIQALASVYFAASTLPANDLILTNTSNDAPSFDDAVYEVKAGFNQPGSNDRVERVSDLSTPAMQPILDGFLASLN